MVSSIQVISGNVSAASAYYAMMYYSGQEQGSWFGDGAELLGLKGKVSEHTFEKLLCGHAPSGQQLIAPFQKRSRSAKKAIDEPRPTGDKESHRSRATDKPHVSKARTEQSKNVLGIDLTYSVPKDVSVLWACSSSKQRAIIEKSCLKAVDRTNSWIEKTLQLARRGQNGHRRLSAKLVGARFLHVINRAGEPQIHVHNVFANAVLGADNRWSKLDSKQLHTWTPAIGRIFRANLASELTKDLGLELSRPKDRNGKTQSWFSISGVPKELADANSSRRKAILEATGPTGLGKGKVAALARQEAAYQTRDRKDPDVSLESIFERVRKQADELGFTKEKRDSLFEKPLSPSEHVQDVTFERALKNAFSRLTEEFAHFRECDLVREVVEELQHTGIDGSVLATRVIEEIPNRPELIPLREQFGEKQFTTKEMWQLEAGFLLDIEALKATRGAQVSEEVCKEVFEKRDWLSDEQKAAVQSLLTSDGSVRILTGVAGAGKSTALAAVKEGLEKTGHRVLGGAIGGATTQDLAEKTGIDSRTVASYLFHFDKSPKEQLQATVKHHTRMLARELTGKPTWQKADNSFDAKTVLILDEAGMLSTKELSRITSLAKEAGVTLILAGDVEQLPAIGAGTPLKRLAADIGHSHLSTNLRQQDELDRAAVSDLRSGDIEQALANYAARGRLTVETGHFETIERLVDTWTSEGGAHQPDRHIVLTQTRSDADTVNRLCQQERLLARDSAPSPSMTFADTRYFEGDRVLFHKADRSKGIENGYFGRVIKVDPSKNELSIRLERERTPKERARGLGQTVTIDLSTHKADVLSLGYAATSHKLQGATVDNAYVLLSGPLNSKEMAYVQATRARLATHLFADSTTAGKQLERLEKALKRSNVKQMAHDIGQVQSLGQ